MIRSANRKKFTRRGGQSAIRNGLPQVSSLLLVLLLAAAPVLAGPRGAVGDLYVCNVRHKNILQFDGLTGEFACIFATRPAGLSANYFQPFVNLLIGG